MKTKYATEAAQAFKKMIKCKQPLKVLVDDGKEFLGAFESLCEKRGIHLYSTFSEKKSAFAERNIRSLKNTIYRYLEEKLTYSYIEKLDQFANKINSRVNRVTNLPPIKLQKKDLPRPVSLSAQTSILQKPKFYFGDFVRIVKKDEAFRKRYKQSFTDEVFELQIFRRCHRQPTPLLTQTKKKQRVNSISQNYNWFVNAANKMARNQIEDEFMLYRLHRCKYSNQNL